MIPLYNQAVYHNGAAGFAFADGHSEIHKWTASIRNLKPVSFIGLGALRGSLRNDADALWWASRTQRKPDHKLP